MASDSERSEVVGAFNTHEEENIHGEDNARTNSLEDPRDRIRRRVFG